MLNRDALQISRVAKSIRLAYLILPGQNKHAMDWDGRRTLPPIRSRASRSVTWNPCSNNTLAQRRPDIPAPMIPTWGNLGAESCRCIMCNAAVVCEFESDEI